MGIVYKAQNGWTPLHCASLYAHVDVAEILAEAGQNTDAIDHVSNRYPYTIMQGVTLKWYMSFAN